tara:strand:- start:78957 stop:80309 length:1353 start_codon:yes stop_codon:yes gene_type:complete
MRNQLRLLRDVSTFILMAGTWRLWFAASDFPAIPFFEFLTAVPRIVDRVLSSVLIAALLVDTFLTTIRCVRGCTSVRSVRIGQLCDLLFITMAVGLALLNQHCLQPWMYHFLLLTPLLWLSRPNSRLIVKNADVAATVESGMREAFSRNAILWLTSSIYFWSACSKLDASFLQSHGPKFVEVICDAVGISTRFWTELTWQIAAATLPVGELLVGVLLLFRRTQSFGLLASLLMHALLIVAVGPWGLNHRAGVLLWNGFFVVQNIILFRAARDVATAGATTDLPGSAFQTVLTAGRASSGPWYRLSVAFLVGAILFPVTHSIGCGDTWPAWAVYASSPARVLVQVQDDSVEQLPESLMPYIEPRPFNDGWSWLRIDLWSLAATGTPIYPEDRFQLGVARFVAEAAESGNGIRIIHEEEADRWTGKRERKEFQGHAEMSRLAAKFHLNTTPH